ncbi:hypothetical protein FSP39_003527 [Pinctada imbricata]|uniref:SET domain-containing protein 9 n=1 Tax=Pinctada imbricata TaxID=66713 RepID=A0AA89BVX4_PINIB|nr:hypothetical protein FSP39_003527 [Pinctada imbricata]
MKQSLGFAVDRHQSTLPTGGTGVFVTEGEVPSGSLVSLYPGTIYDPHNPILIQSLGNPFIFRCIDGTLIDGNDKGLSNYIYRSCSGRDRHGPYETSDCTWLTQYPINPLAVGQYVNNQSKKFPANVAYQELDLPSDFPFHLLKYIPNVHYTPVSQLVDPTVTRLRRVVILVSLRNIHLGEELFSSYFTVVH